MANKSGAGGTYTHKNPACRCSPCTARRRKAEALLGGTGAGWTDLATKTPPPTTARQISPEYPLHTTGSADDTKARVVQWMAMRAADPMITNRECAQRMGMTRQNLSYVLNKAVAEGWLKFDDPIERLEHEIIPKALDNLTILLNDRDRVATLETMKGTSFPAYREAKGIGDAPQTVLALKIETADPSQAKIVTGTIVGRPKELKE